eukprot:10195-Heterococcus_DN1.PRE.2
MWSTRCMSSEQAKANSTNRPLAAHKQRMRCTSVDEGKNALYITSRSSHCARGVQSIGNRAQLLAAGVIVQ